MTVILVLVLAAALVWFGVLAIGIVLTILLALFAVVRTMVFVAFAKPKPALPKPTLVWNRDTPG